MNTVTERLLNITGEDAVSVNRKNKDIRPYTMPARVMIVSNEVPKFADNSGAVAGRFAVIRYYKSVKGREDRGLERRLAEELPGVFNWAMAGLKRLNEQGRFTVTESTGDTGDLMRDLGSPLRTFFEDSPGYEVTGDMRDYVPVKDVHRAYKMWCMSTGEHPMTQTNFLRACDSLPGVISKNTAVDGRPKARLVFGVRGHGGGLPGAPGISP